ncbi:MOSC N-terminal beta barrel domain-containing protein [Halobacteria archaeon AArc-curdl1]|uniref:MOSC N-terminal beta barrel domain-containing protein n=1 Tax=Natronosalvus hydrolyticus TaxID=2979988 RepID=A0AAP2ZEF4_9EURY|nr:MOSC N-terminal beta barrel domain-containing protein [Halobacteria archaeon AArc-curdl1]
MVHLERIFVHPIKSLDPTPVDRATLVENGALEWDRRYAILDQSGEYVNGKRERSIHRLRTSYDLDRMTVTIGTTLATDGRVDAETPATDERANAEGRTNTEGTTRTFHPEEQTFHLEEDRETLESWLTDFFGYDVHLVRDDEGGYPDDTDASGPTLISTETLDAVSAWFDDIDVAEMRRRLRANLELSTPTAFWEDRLYEKPGRAVPFTIGTTRLYGINPCQRCVVPTRHPDTGERTPGFQERFVSQREATLPEWADRAWFDHYFRLMVNTKVPESDWGETLAVGDELETGDSSVPVTDQ